MSVKDKKITLDLSTIDGNAHSLMAAFSKQADKEDWSQVEIKDVLNECRSGDYNHLIQTLLGVTE